jgi:hypothetical protein
VYRPLQVGDKLRALWSDEFDGVTKGKIYEVKEIIRGDYRDFFKIENDEGIVTLPISVRFERVKEDD